LRNGRRGHEAAYPPTLDGVCRDSRAVSRYGTSLTTPQSIGTRDGGFKTEVEPWIHLPPLPIIVVAYVCAWGMTSHTESSVRHLGQCPLWHCSEPPAVDSLRDSGCASAELGASVMGVE